MTSFPALSLFDAVEVMPVYEDREEGWCEPVPDAPHSATFWTVYGHLRTGGVEALIDCADEASAERAATLLGLSLKMLEALKWQDMADADPAVARRKGYDKRARQLCRSAIAAAQRETS